MIDYTDIVKPIDAEQALLGALILDSSKLEELLKGGLNTEFFYLKKHQIIFNAIKNLFESQNNIDPITIKYEIASMVDEIPAVEEVYLYELANNVPSTKNISQYYNIILNGYEHRCHTENIKI